MRQSTTAKTDPAAACAVRITVGSSRHSKNWRGEDWTWGELAARLAAPTRTAERIADYVKMSRAEQGDIKDIGGYVGGVINGARRQKGAMAWRTLITLDADFADNSFIDAVRRHLSCAWVAHTTHKHTPAAQRYRLIIPTNRPMQLDEYAFISRRIAIDIGIGYFDKTTHAPERLMYWPSAASDGKWDYRREYGEALDVDAMLAANPGWEDMSEWRDEEEVGYKRLAQKQQDPLTKPGIVGVFCREYSLTEAMDVFLPGVYVPTEQENRYTYTDGTTSGGALVFEDKFLYSFHATDPCSEHLVNAFDLVRLHKFGAMDADAKEGTVTSKLPSYLAMQDLASEDGRVKIRLHKEQLADFDDVDAPESTEDWGWTAKLTLDRQARLLPTAANFKVILEHHPAVRGLLIYNDFSSRFEVLRQPPWRRGTETGSLHWGEADDAGLANWLEETYRVRKPSVLKDVLSEYRYIHHYHPVRDYLNSLEWDGEARADTVIIDFLGAEDSPYVRTVTRKMLLAAVARVFEPGIKFDYMLVFVGGQGIGKSYFIKRLGGKWSSDSATSMSGKESFEQLQGKWILEFGELAAMRKMEIEQVKFYISKDTDSFRPAYGYRVEDYPRQCVFFGSTNNQYFLKDPTGNRRFWPVEVSTGRTQKLFDEFDKSYIDQVWAEMVHAWKGGERKLYLSEDEEKEAFARQQAHREVSEKSGMVEVYLDTLLPESWDNWSIEQRQTQFDGASDIRALGVRVRDRVCVAEIWSECFQGAQGKMQRRDATEIHEIMMTMPGWARYTEGGGKIKFGPYGAQRGYVRIEK